MDCLFCKIIQGSIPAEIVHQNEQILAFKDVNPQAPMHILLIPKKHISTMNDLTAADGPILGQLMLGASQLAKDLDIAEEGYRVVMNCNLYGGQSVYHLHLHLLGRRQMHWPPG